MSTNREQISGGLVVEPDPSDEAENFGDNLAASIDNACTDLTGSVNLEESEVAGWKVASDTVKEFGPIPWFIWRLTNIVLSPAGMKGGLAEGFVLGLRRLLFATASDNLFGSGQKTNTLKEALSVVSPDVIGAVSATHAICRKLAKRENERLWRPIVDEALLRARIGFLAARNQREFGCGRGLLAGLVSRMGLAILLGMGEEDRAKAAIEEIALGKDMGTVGRELYRCHPLHVGGMLLSVIGCGSDASFGIIAYLSKSPLEIVANYEQRQWLAVLTIVEAIRSGTIEAVEIDHWEVLELDNSERRERLIKEARVFARGDHGLHWLE